MLSGDTISVWRSSIRRFSVRERQRPLAFALVVGFIVASYIGLNVVTYASKAPASWMGSSFLICAMVLLQGRLRRAAVAVCVAAAFAAALLAKWPLVSAGVFTVFTAAESALASWLLLRLSRTPRLANIKQAAKLVAFVILPTTLASSVAAGVACQLIYGRGLVSLALQWFEGHATGMLMALPTLLVLVTPDPVAAPRRGRIETALMLAAIAVFAFAPFTVLNNVTFLLILPAATIFAFRLGLKATVAAILAITALNDLYYYTHPNPAVWGPTLSVSTIILIGQAYNIGVYLNGLFTGLAVNYQARLKQQLEHRTAMARAARSAAMAASRAKTEFLATMSHEIRTPLNGVLGFTQVLLRARRLSRNDRQQVELIAASGQALLTVVNDILDFSKVEAGEAQLDPKPTPLVQLCHDVCAIVRPEAERKGLALELALDAPRDLAIVVDDQRLKQVLLNLLNNAVKFTALGGVTLAARWDGALLRMEVRDTGPGIAPDALPRLFHRFSQADSSISRRHGGTGLGLAICKSLTELMGGRIGVDSDPGHGATFWIELTPPLADTSWREAAAPQTDEATHGEGVGAHVLLVDDHAVNRQLGVTMLNMLGCTCDVGENGVEALAAAREGRYDLILMDVHMPVMDGLEATRAIRALDGPVGRTPIISMSADVMSEQVERSRAAGMNDAVAKPVSLADLQACLERWIPSPTGEGGERSETGREADRKRGATVGRA